jgi:class 3 adenylate cyclase
MTTTTRKLAAILAADVVGYWRMMGEDEAGTARFVRERREAAAPIVGAHGGRYRFGGVSDNPTYLHQRERVIDGLRSAGAPEG